MATIIVTASDGATDTTFDESERSGARAKFVKTGVSVSAAQSIEKNHEIKPGVGEGNDKHTITIRHNMMNAASDGILQGSLKCEWSIPRDSAWTEVKSRDLTAHLMSQLKTAHLSSFLSGAIGDGDMNVTGPFNPSLA
jgi:hypothetical protein